MATTTTCRCTGSAVENPSQGNIMRIPMNSRELHGLVSGGRKAGAAWYAAPPLVLRGFKVA